MTADAVDGTIVVSSLGSGFINRNPDYFATNYDSYNSSSLTTAESNNNTDDVLQQQQKPYNLFKIAPSDEKLSSLVFNELIKEIEPERILVIIILLLFVK